MTAAPANEFGTATARSAGSITTKADATKPAVTLTKPSSPARSASWATLRGKATDVGMGVRGVSVTAIEKRGTAWYYYNGVKWVKATSGSAAVAKAKVLTVTPSTSGAWILKIKGLAKGTARFTYSAVDKAGNRSAAKLLNQKLTS
ncbi:5'-nucleotidase [Actinoplanes derwentensis]|uniref:5'-nucleotidase n=1 Tax=Actinoplanes derwentensis TaxID=113562 RepID=A0A1H1Z6A1_9ACTN|nr:5'-nucleotidase [Actinoplanes derwentensis]